MSGRRSEAREFWALGATATLDCLPADLLSAIMGPVTASLGECDLLPVVMGRVASSHGECGLPATLQRRLCVTSRLVRG